ncbi:hypothetical protein DH2020_030300 [Rehmannia glutinosa]|uniref:Pentatricopeptide repeat-containing protein n=1 Tax=Rehmannia glutinosa TaxID=99300 RepID=A0ABR0VL78_REHGL
MDIFSISSVHCSHTPTPFSTSNLAGKQHYATTSTPPALVILASNSPQDFGHNPTTNSAALRRPTTHKPLKTSTAHSTQLPENPLKKFVNSQNSPPSPVHHPMILSVKSYGYPASSPLRPLPPPPFAPLQGTLQENEIEDEVFENSEENEKEVEFREKGKIFVGNLPLWIKKHERNMGFGFVIYSGHTAEKAAMKAVEFDGVEFHGRVLTVKLDNGKRMKGKYAERARWVEGKDGDEGDYRSKWHEEREGSRKEFRKVLESQPENWQAVVRAFDRIKKPSRREFGLMVNYYARRGDMHRARETFEKMRARGIEPTLHVYTNLIHAYAVGRDMEEALSCVRKMRDEGIEMSLVTYSILVGGFAKFGNVQAAELWFKEAKDRLTALNAIIYGNIIYACCQTCNMNRAEELVREMEEAGIDAPIDIYHTMMDGYTMIKNEEKCIMVFDRLKECGFAPSVVTCGCLINLYTKMGKVYKALEVSDMMKSAGIKHNLKTYSMLINGFINLKDWANAFSIFEDVIRDGLKPDVILYNNIIRAFCGMGNVERAIRTVEEMKKERHRPTSRTFMPIIHCFARAGEMRRALDVFDMMRRSGCIPTVHTYNSLILGLVEKRQMEKAVDILDEMLLAGMSPNEHSYTTIMHGYASLGDTGKAFEYFSKMKNEGLELDVYTYEALLKACCKAAGCKSGQLTIGWAEIWARRGDVWEAADLMQQMRQEGVQPDIHTYTSFINACCKAGDMLRAMKTIEEMEALGVKANVKTYTTLIHGWSRASLPEKALKCFEEMKHAGLKPDKAVYHCLMTSLLSRATVAEDYIHMGILSLCEEMVERGLTVDMGTAVHWSKCLHKIERCGGGITEALQKTFPPDWNSHKTTLNAISDVSDREDDDELTKMITTNAVLTAVIPIMKMTRILIEGFGFELRPGVLGHLFLHSLESLVIN